MVNDWSPMEVSDRELLAAIRAGDMDATVVFVERHMDWAIGRARKLGAGQDARDVAHDALFGLIQKPPVELREASVRALLGTDLHHRVARARKKRERVVMEPGSSLVDSVALSSLVRLRERAGAMLEGLGRLEGREQRVLRMRFFDEQRFREIGEQLGVSESAARGAVFRALRSLRREVRWLARDEQTSSA